MSCSFFVVQGEANGRQARVPTATAQERHFTLDRTLELTRLIYAAASGASQWQRFLVAFSTSVGACGSALRLRDTGGDGQAAGGWFGHSDDDARAYAQFAEADPWHLAASSLGEGVVATSAELCLPEDMEASSAYREYYEPRGLRYGMGGVILSAGGERSTISVHRGRQAGPFGRQEVAALEMLMPDLRLAARLHTELLGLRTRVGAFSAHLDRYAHGVALIDGERRLLYANAFAAEVTTRRDGLQIDAGRLVALAEDEDAAVREAVQEVAADPRAEPRRMKIRRAASPDSYRVMVLAAGVPEAGAGGGAGPAVAVILIDPAHAPAPEPAALREFFSLTGSESRVVSLLAQGLSLEEVTLRLGITVATARTHLRNAFAKTGTSRQGELVALVLRSVPVNGGPGSGKNQG